MGESGEQTPFIASQDIADSLKLEASALSPVEQSRVETSAKEISNVLVKEFKDFIPSVTLERKDGLEKKIIVVDNATLQTIPAEWGTGPPPHKISGFAARSNLLFLQTPDDYWRRLPKDLKQRAIQRHESEDKAREVYGWTELTTALAHEIAHLFGDRFEGYGRLPLWFEEAGAYYYQRVIEKQLNLKYLVDDRSEDLIQLYRPLVATCGDDVHRLYFGSDLDPKREDQILSIIPEPVIKSAFFAGSTSSPTRSP